MPSMHRFKKVDAVRIGMMCALLLTPCHASFALAPPSRYAEISSDPALPEGHEILLAKIMSIIKKDSLDKPGDARAQERLQTIVTEIDLYIEPLENYIAWKNVFHSGGADYFEFRIDDENYTFAFSKDKLETLATGSFQKAILLADVVLELPEMRRKTSRKESELLRYSDELLKQAVDDGQFFKVKNLADADLTSMFRGDAAAIMERFVRQIDDIPEAKRIILRPKMLRTLSLPSNRDRLFRMFKKLQETAIALKKRGEDDLGQRHFVLVLGNTLTPLLHVRNEEGRPFNVLAHTRRKYNSICFGLDAAEDYVTKSDALGIVIRMENAFLRGREENLTPGEVNLLMRLDEQHITKHVVAKRKEFDNLENAILQLIEHYKSVEKKEEAGKKIRHRKSDKQKDARLKKVIRRKILKSVPATTPIQWHLIAHRANKDILLFSAAGKRFYIEYDHHTGKAIKNFDALENLYQLLYDTVKKVLGDVKKSTSTGNSWEDILEKITHLSSECRDRLKPHGRGDIANLLDYVTTMDHSNGYIDDISWLTGQMQQIKDQNNVGTVPAIFVKKPLQELEYTAVQTLVGPRKQGKDPDILEISAVRFRGMRVIGKFHEFIRLPKASRKELDALLKVAHGYGITNPHVFDNAAPKEEVLARFKAFLGNRPIFTHGNMAKVEVLRHYCKESMTQQVVNTMELASKSIGAKELGVKPNYSLPAMCQHLGIEMPKNRIRGIRLLRLYQHMSAEVALRAQATREIKNLNNQYDRLLAKFMPTVRTDLEDNFNRASEHYPGKLMRVNSWDEVNGAVNFTNPKQPEGIQLLALDFDETIAASLGWVGSDAWYRSEVRLKELYSGLFYTLLNRLNRFLTTLGFFEPMESQIAQVIRNAQAKGIKVIILTARGPWEGHHKLLSDALDKMGITIEPDDIVMTGDDFGNIDKVGGLRKYCTDHFKEKRPNIMYMDDGEHYLEKMANDAQLEPYLKKLIWYQSKKPTLEHMPYTYYLREAEKTLADNPKDDHVLAYLLNAFFIAYERTTPDETIATGEEILRLLGQFQGSTPMREELLNLVRERIQEDPELRGALLLQEILKAQPDTLVIFTDLYPLLRGRWGEIKFTKADERYLSQNSRLEAQRDIRAKLNPETNALIGLWIAKWRKEPLGMGLQTALPGFGDQDKRGNRDGERAMRRARLLRTQELPEPEIFGLAA